MPVPVSVAPDGVVAHISRLYEKRGQAQRIATIDQDAPMVLSKGGKKMVIMPLNLDGDKVTVAEPAQPTAETTTPPSNQPAPQEQSGAQTQERTEMPKKNTTTEAAEIQGKQEGSAKETTTSSTATTVVKEAAPQICLAWKRL